MGPRHKIDRLRNPQIVAAAARGGRTPSSVGPGHVARTRPQLLSGLDPILDGVVVDATPQFATALDLA
jgi:hypothetical protein